MAESLPNSVSALGLKGREAVALKQGLQFLDNTKINIIERSPKVRKATVNNEAVYSLKANESLRVMFGLDKVQNKVIVYDVIKKPSVKKAP